MVNQALMDHDQRTQNQMKVIHDELEAASKQFAGMQSNQSQVEATMKQQRDELAEYLRNIEVEKTRLSEQLGQEFKAKQDQIAELAAQLQKFQVDKDSIIREIEAKQKDFEAMKVGIDAQLGRAEAVINEQTGGWKRETQQAIERLSAFSDNRIRELSAEIRTVADKLSAVRAQPNMGGPSRESVRSKIVH